MCLFLPRNWTGHGRRFLWFHLQSYPTRSHVAYSGRKLSGNIIRKAWCVPKWHTVFGSTKDLLWSSKMSRRSVAAVNDNIVPPYPTLHIVPVAIMSCYPKCSILPSFLSILCIVELVLIQYMHEIFVAGHYTTNSQSLGNYSQLIIRRLITGSDRMQSEPIATNVVSSNPAHAYLIQH